MKKLRASVQNLVAEELERANEKFPLFHSDHEAYGVIGEEIEEVERDYNALFLEYLKFKNEVYCDSVEEEKRETINSIKRQATYLACEAIQVAAMADKWEMSNEQPDTVELKIELTDREKGIFVIKEPSFLKGTIRLEGDNE